MEKHKKKSRKTSKHKQESTTEINDPVIGDIPEPLTIHDFENVDVEDTLNSIDVSTQHETTETDVPSLSQDFEHVDIVPPSTSNGDEFDVFDPMYLRIRDFEDPEIDVTPNNIQESTKHKPADEQSCQDSKSIASPPATNVEASTPDESEVTEVDPSSLAIQDFENLEIEDAFTGTAEAEVSVPKNVYPTISSQSIPASSETFLLRSEEASASSSRYASQSVEVTLSTTEDEQRSVTSVPSIDEEEPSSVLVQDADIEDVDDCEEALSELATAPVNFESGDFYSLQQSPEKLVNVLDLVEEETDVFKPDEKPGLHSQITHLYNNYLLENNSVCVNQFLDSLQPACEGFELFELLSNYLRACNHLHGCEKSLSALKENCDEFEKGVWSHRVKTLSQNTTCDDGVTLTATYKVHTAEFSSSTFSQLTRSLKDIKELVKDSISLYTYSVQLSKTQIEHFLFKSFGNFNLESFQIQNYTPGYPTADVRGFAGLLKRTITVFFHFLRKPLLQSSFVQDVQHWVSQCAGLLLRIATIEDHIFLLNHVIRLPPKLVTKFASSLVQVPPIPIPTNPSEYSASFAHLHVDYALTFLSTILSPVPKRTQLLHQYQIASKSAGGSSRSGVLSPDSSLQWVMVDSDGEDDGDEGPFFKESDLIALLQQVPFDKIFRRIMLIYTDGDPGEDVLDLTIRSEHSVLKLIAFGSQLIAILGNGLVTYYTDRYRQLMKLIGRLILHMIQYVSDQLELFVEAGGRSYTGTQTPVFREYDIFMYNAVNVLLTGKNVGMSQFLAAVPYHLLSTQMLWSVYALVTKWDCVGEDISSEFEHEVVAMTESNAFYTLTAMSNMALARQGKENQFVKVVTFHLFQIGFLSPLTRDSCSKSVRDLLGNLSSYSGVISYLLQNIKQKLDVLSKSALFLVRELDFGQWIPTKADMQLLSHWMLNFHTFSLENQLARFILRSMNWDFGNFDELFLLESVHAQVALLVVQAHFKWERPQNVIAESVKQLSSWVTRNPDFTSWTWTILGRLHLHAYDLHKSSAPRLGRIVSRLPTFEGNLELEVLKKAVDEKNPVACAVALLMTPIGHSLPLVCSQGFDLMEILLQNSKFDVVINLLFFIIPLFAGSRESIVACEKFRNILTTLLASDMTYVRMAKSLITAEFPGCFTKTFGDMIHSQLEQHFRFGTTKRRLILLWLDLFTKIQNWNKDNNILYLLDVIAEFSFSEDAETEKVFHEYFSSMYKEMPSQNSSGIVGYLFNWSYSAGTILPNASYPQMPYLVYFILTIESELETETGFWKSLSKSLANPKTTLENAVKKACSSCKYSTTTHYLTIYRWAQNALELPLNHPLLLIFWQKFFVKYFYRAAPSDTGGGIGERFFEGMINTAFLKKLKKRLHETLQFYTNEMNKLENDAGSVTEVNSGENTAFILERLKKCFSLTNGMTLWIEDSSFHQASLYIPALPPQYLPVQLHTLVEGDFGDWTEFIDIDEILADKKSKLQCFLCQISRISWISQHTKPIPKLPSCNSSQGNREEELLKRLNSYDKPVDPPPVPTFPQILPPITSPMFTEIEAMETGLKGHFRNLQNFAQQFSLQISKHTALDCTYWDNLPNLYTITDGEELVQVDCSTKRTYGCSGPGHVIFKFSQARLNERVGHIIHSNRTEYYNLISQSLVQPPPVSISVGAVFIEDFITNLILFHRNLAPTSDDRTKVSKIGTELFYLIVNEITEDSNFYPPTRQLFSSFLEVLGHQFLENDPTQCQRLVTASIARPGLVGTLTPHMNLLTSSAEALLHIYEDVIHIPERNGDLAFVILSKLDLLAWMRKWKPRLVERSQLIFLMWKAATAEPPAGETKNAMVHGIYRSHLKSMLLYDFPQHYGEILTLLLEDSEKGVVPLEIWYDFCNGLSRDAVKFSQEMDPFLRKRELKRFSMEVDMLRHQELIETAVLLGNHFKKERLAYGVYGLYPKYRSYVHPLSCFLQMISYSLISSSLKNSKGVASQQIEAVWPFLRDLYNPWLLPYNQRMIQQNCAQWIQQMNSDTGSVLQPWISSDSNYAALFMNDFTDSVLFLAETLPGCPALFSHLWNYYAENFAHVTVKEHVISIVNNCFISIPWALFWPTIADMESMNKVVEKYLPACHSLLGVIFAQIHWREWVEQLNGSNGSVKNKCYAILLNLSVHLATDIVARESPTWTSVMEVIQSLNWDYILSNSLEPVLNWFLMSVDPRVVLGQDVSHNLDKASFQLIRIASGFGAGPLEQTKIKRLDPLVSKMDLNRKRYLFVRTYVRLLLSTSTKYKNLLQTNPIDFESSLQRILDDISVPVKNEKQDRAEFSQHLKEVVGLISNHSLGTLARNATISWFEANKDAPLPLIYEILQITFAAKVQPYTSLPLLEVGIPLVFRHSSGNWKAVAALAAVVAEQSEQTQYLDVASKDGHFLALYALLLNRTHFYTHGALQAVSSLTEILKNLKPKESNEAALPLLYNFFFKISVALLNEGAKHLGGHLEKAVKKFLTAFCLHLTSVGDDKQGWVLLGVLGLTKSSLLSVRGRLFARCLSVFLMAQLPVNAPVRLQANEGDPVPATKSNAKPHGELESSLQKLEELKGNKQYSELVECIDSAVGFIRDPSETLSSHGKFIQLLVAQLFTEPFLLVAEF